MALTGLEIYKQLPKENCKECGLTTCLAFAMKVAAGQTELTDCPRLAEDVVAQLSEASAPPQRLVKMGADPNPIEVGQETVLYRHDEKFYHPTAIALKISDALSDAEIKEACAAFKALQFHRVGETLKPDMVALVNDSGSADKMQTAAELIYNELGVGMILIGEKLDNIAASAIGPLSGTRVVLYCTGDAPVERLAEVANQAGAVICVSGSIEAVAAKAEALGKADTKDILISPGEVIASEALGFLSQTRRAALNKKFRPLGWPVMALAYGEDKTAAALDACAYVCKYAAVVVTDAWEPYDLLPILTTRQNIFTDPQKPVQVEPGLYDVGDVAPDSPLLVTTNFSLSYYSVESEVETSRIPCRILAVDTEGTSVLTAWAADKFNSETITAALKTTDAQAKVEHQKVVLPGHVAVLAASVAEDSGWQVLVGPKEASAIGPYLKKEWKTA